MADEKIVTNIVANSDFSNLIADVHKVTASLSQLQEKIALSNKSIANQIAVMNRSFSETIRSTGQFSTHFVSLTSDVEKFGKNLDSGKLKLNQYFKVWQDHTRTSGGLIRQLAQQQVQMQNAILQPLGRNAQGLMQFNVHVPRGLDAIKNKSALARQELQIMNKVIQDGGVQLINWGKNTQWAGRQLTVGLTVPMIAFGKAASDAFRVADQELTRLTKVYGDLAGSSAQELAKVRQEVSKTSSELSKAYGVNFQETIGLAADIAATGKTGNELLASVKETTRLAVLGEVDRQEAMKATLAIQSAFKQNTDELSQSIDFLNAVENQTSTSLADLVEAIPKAGPVVKGLGGDVKDLALYLTAMREGGINAAEGANAIKSSLASLINPTNVAVEKFKSFGIDLMGIVNNNAGNVTGTLLELQSALDRLNPLQKQQAIEQLFGKFQFARMGALFENLGKQGSQTLKVLDLMKASSQELASVAGRELAQVTESASGRYNRAIQGLKADLAGVGEQFLNITTHLINALDKVIQFADKLPKPLKQALAIAGGFTALAGPVIMLTGVLANFFGYIIKGLGHFKALFRGGEGFKLLTPEILAAQKAGTMMENTFYSDAKAAAVLQVALKNLIDELAILEQKAASPGISTQPVISTVAGNIVGVGGRGRVVDPNHPLAGDLNRTARASAHMNPRDPNNPATIFGLVPGAEPVNRLIGRTPQIYMNERLPNVEGVTSVGGISTGVVAEEAARHHAMMATLGMQSAAEIKELKRTIAAGGAISSELMQTFDDILPITQRLTQNAAAQSAGIVAELRAGKINVEQAKAQIIALNAQIETQMGQEVVAYAASTGRTIDLTKAPLIDQPVVDAKGKSNLRGMYRKGIFRRVMESIGRATKTRTYGAPYNIETTMPRKLNSGGNVFYNNGDQVPGPNVNSDVVPAMLTPGEFVIRRDVAQQDPDGMRALNNGEAVIVPVQKRIRGGKIFGLRAIQQYMSGVTRRSGTLRGSARSIDEMLGLGLPAGAKYTPTGGIMTEKGKEIVGKVAKPASGLYIDESVASEINRRLTGRGLSGDIVNKYLRGLLGFGGGRVVGSTNTLLNSLGSHIVDAKLKDQIFKEINSSYIREVMKMKRLGIPLTDSNNPYHDISSNVIRKYSSSNPALRDVWNQWSKSTSGVSPVYLSELRSGRGATASSGNQKISIIDPITGERIIIDELQGVKGKSRFLHSRNRDWESQFSLTSDVFAANRGGMVPGYAGGGRVQAFTKSMIMKKLGAMWGKQNVGPGWEHKSAQIGMGSKLFGKTGLRPYTQNLLYDALLETVSATRPYGYFKTQDGKLLRGIGPDQTDEMIRDAAEIVARRHGKQISPIDKKILKEQFTDWNLKSLKSTPIVNKAIFGANAGGKVLRFNRGGMVPGSNIPRYGLGGMVGQLLLGTAGSFGGQMLGQQVAGNIGGNVGSMLGFMLPSMLGQTRGGFNPATIGQKLGTSAEPTSWMSKSIFANTKFANSIGTSIVAGNKFTSTLGRLALGASRANAVLAAGTAVAIGLYKAYQEGEKSQRLARESFGLTASAATKAGLNYVDYKKKISDSVKSIQAFKDKNTLLYESMKSANTPFDMTIEQYKNLRTELKKTMSDQIEIINRSKGNDVSAYAVKLKEQFLAAGMSAEEATKKIFTLIKLSNKASIAGAVISGSRFANIKTAEEGAVSAVGTFKESIKVGDAQAQANALNTALQAIDTGVESIYDKLVKANKKNKTNKTESVMLMEAEAKQLDMINAKQENQVAIGRATFDELSKQNPEIRKFATAQDTVVSLWQKIRLQASGFTGDLTKLNTKQTDALYQMSQIINKATVDANKSKGGLLEKQYQNLDKLTAQQKKLLAASKIQSAKDQIDARKAIQAIDDKIAAINKEADARKKALQDQSTGESYIIDLQKAQLDYQKAIATGDTAGAAAAQLRINEIVNARQSEKAQSAIDTATAAKIEPLQAQRKKLTDAQQDLADSAALASESLDSVNKKVQDQKTKIDDVNSAMAALKLNMEAHAKDLDKYKTTKEFQGLASNLVNAVKSAGISMPTYGSDGKKLDPVQQAMDLYNKAVKSIDKGIETTGDIYINSKKIANAESGMEYKAPTKSQFNQKMFQKDDSYLIMEFAGRKVAAWAESSEYKRVWEKAIKAGAKITGWSKSIPKGYTAEWGWADGGYISGPGTGTSDSIPAMLSNGEYVINAKSVQAAGLPMLDSINKMAKGGLATRYDVPRYTGSRVNMASGGEAVLGGTISVTNNFEINGTNMTKEEIGRVIVDLQVKQLSRLGVDRSR